MIKKNWLLAGVVCVVAEILLLWKPILLKYGFVCLIPSVIWILLGLYPRLKTAFQPPFFTFVSLVPGVGLRAIGIYGFLALKAAVWHFAATLAGFIQAEAMAWDINFRCSLET
jgi:hypothetical protein